MIIRRVAEQLGSSLRYVSVFPALLALLLSFPQVAYSDLQLSNISNFSLGTWSGSGSITDSYNLCVYVTAADSGPEYMIMGSTGNGSVFEVSDGRGNYIEFDVFWNDQTGSSGQLQMTAGSASSIGVQTGANTTESNCGGTMNANIEIRFSSGNLGSAIAGTYNGTLTLTLTPKT